MKTFSGRRASQDEFELNSLIELFKLRGVRSYLEIGARHGDTFFDVMRSLPKGSLGVAVDLGGGAWGTPKSVHSLKKVIRALNNHGYNCHAIFGDSASLSVQTKVKEFGNFDACFIDGDHRYISVRADWEIYGKANLVAFHDINGEGQSDKAGNKVEVPRLWNELKKQFNTDEFINENSRMGIGIIFK